MVITTEYVEVEVGGGPMRMLVCAPRGEGVWPGVLCYSDIFQLTGPTVRACARLAGYGFVVAAPEIYHRLEPPGTVIAFDDAGRERGLEDASRTSVEEFDADCRAALDYLAAHTRVSAGRLAAAGFCIGGHLAFRAALHRDVRATACFYPTGVHNGKLGKDADAGTLARAREIRGEMLLVFGSEDPHVPGEGREKIAAALREAGASFELKLYAAAHAFMRDEGPRYDPEAADAAFADMLKLFRRTLN
jgi:carboxymethylenebutenolidase